MNTLLHYQSDVVTLDRTRTYEQPSSESPYDKPKGLWVSVEGEDDWRHWCETEDFRTEALAVPHEVKLTEDADLLLLKDADDLLEFQHNYGTPYRFSSRGDLMIEWKRVAREFAGIIIAPYQWKHRLNLSWYYTWDCSSGCIWDLSVVDTFAPLTEGARS